MLIRRNFKSRLRLIVRVSVVLNRTVFVDSDWHFDNVCGSHLQSQSELYHISDGIILWLLVWLVNYVVMLWLPSQRYFFSYMSSLFSSSDLDSKDVHMKQHTSYDDTAQPTQAKNYPDNHKSRLKCLICGTWSPKESQETQRLVFYLPGGSQQWDQDGQPFQQAINLDDLTDCWKPFFLK